MILVTGATGHLGKAVIEQLLKKTSANRIAALVRDEGKAADLKAKGVNIRVGSYDNVPSLDKAMQGVEKVLLIAGTDEEARLRQHQHVIDAAKKAGVQSIAYTSRTLKDRNTMVNRLMEGHFQTEDAIKASGLRYTLFRNVLYMDVIPQFVGKDVFNTGIHIPAGEGSVAFALRSEMGEAIANELVENNMGNATYHFTGTEAYSFADVAAALAELSGKKLAYIPAEKSAFESGMKSRNMPDLMVKRVVDFITDIKNGQEDETSADLANFLGRKPATLKEGLKILYNL